MALMDRVVTRSFLMSSKIIQRPEYKHHELLLRGGVPDFENVMYRHREGRGTHRGARHGHQ